VVDEIVSEAPAATAVPDERSMKVVEYLVAGIALLAVVVLALVR
jgi:hypothetical protein